MSPHRLVVAVRTLLLLPLLILAGSSHAAGPQGIQAGAPIDDSGNILLTNESWPGAQWQWHENNHENTGGDGYNPYIDEFGYMAGRVAAHFNGRIKHWEIWNEPNCYSSSPWPGAYEGCSYIYPSNFAALLGHAYTQSMSPRPSGSTCRTRPA